MNRVFYRTLISHVDEHVEKIPTYLNRIHFGFFTEQSINCAIKN
jgi:hypothetical protein